MGTEKGAGPLFLTAFPTLHTGALLALTAEPWAFCHQAPLLLFPGAPGEFRGALEVPTLRGAFSPCHAAVGIQPQVSRVAARYFCQVHGRDGRDSWVPQTCDSSNTTLLPRPASETDDFLKRG